MIVQAYNLSGEKFADVPYQYLSIIEMTQLYAYLVMTQGERSLRARDLLSEMERAYRIVTQEPKRMKYICKHCAEEDSSDY